MKVIKLAVISLMFFSVCEPAHAQFDKFMKDMKGAADLLQQVAPPGSSPQPAPGSSSQAAPGSSSQAAPGSSPSRSGSAAGVSFDAQNYCAKVRSSQLVADFKVAVRTAEEQKIHVGDALLAMGKRLLDNENGDLVKWFDQKLKGMGHRDMMAENETLNKLYKIAMECAASVAQEDTFLFFAYDPMNYERGSIERQRESFVQGKGNLGYGGSDNLRRDSQPGRKPFSSRWASILAFAIEGGEEQVALTAGNLKELYDSYFAKELQEKRVAQAKREQEAAAKQAEADREAEALAKRQAYEESPEGRLLRAYQYFQVVSVCHDMRKGYAVQFINDGELSQYKTKMKAIETKLKGSVSHKTTDQLWAEAEKENRTFDVTRGMAGEYAVRVDLIDTIETNNKSNWVAAKNDCDAIAGWFRDVADEVLGKEGLKKNF